MLIPLLLVLATLPVATDSDSIDTLVVCPQDFQVALRPWVEYRQGQGHRIAVRPPTSTAGGIKLLIKEFAAGGELKHVVLVGDSGDANAERQRLVPTDYIDAKVNVKFGSEPEIATDHTYADLDGDNVLDLNIGRMPVDSAGELSAFIDRIIQYESADNQGDWQRRVNFIAGVGGFGQMLDKMIEQSVKQIVTDLIPSECDVSMTYGSWRSPYCPDPLRFSDTAISRFNQGCQFWVYVGHGERRQLDKIRLPDRRIDILNPNNVSRLASSKSSPIAILLSCYSAATDDERDGLAELMMKQPGGPIGVVSSTRVSMPYAMGIFSLEMLDGFYAGNAETVGELITQSKRNMFKFDEKKSRYHELLSLMGKSFSPEPGLLDDERGEHVHLMHWLGDPLLRLHRPAKLKLKAPESAMAGETIEVSGVARGSGQLTLELSYRRDRFRNRPPRRRSYTPGREFFESYQDVYEKTQKLVCVQNSTSVSEGAFSKELEIPSDCSGACHVRAMFEGEKVFALGSQDIFIKKNR